MNVDDVVSSLFDEFRKSLEPKVTELFNNYQLYKETYEAVAKIPFVKSLIDSQKKSENPSVKILHPSPSQQINLEIIDDTTESSPPNLESIADYINTMTQNSFQPFNRIHLDENTTDNIEDYEKEYQEDEEDEDEKEEKMEAKDSEKEAMKEELEEAYATVKQLQGILSEVNLLNAKLLYTNKLFRNFELNEDQKMKVIENFDRAGNTREVKLVFTTLAESFNRPATKKRVVKESYASKPAASTAPSKETTQVLSEGFELANRWKKLAGLL